MADIHFALKALPLQQALGGAVAFGLGQDTLNTLTVPSPLHPFTPSSTFTLLYTCIWILMNL